MKQRKTSVELVDRDKCVDMFEGGQYDATLAAALRAREIQIARLKEERKGNVRRYPHKPTVQALLDVQAGHVGEEYILKSKDPISTN